MNTLKKHSTYLYFLLILLLAGYLFTFTSPTSSHQREKKENTGILIENIMDTKTGKPITLPIEQLTNDTEKIIIEATLPATNWEDPVLLFSTTNQKVTVYNEEEILYDYQDQDGHTLPQGELGTSWHFVPLSQQSSTQKINIALTSSVPNGNIQISEIHIGTNETSQNYIHDQSSQEYLFSLCLFVLKISILFMLLFFGKENRKSNRYYWKLVLFLTTFSFLFLIQGKRLISYFYHPLIIEITLQVCFILTPWLLFSFIQSHYIALKNNFILYISDIVLKIAGILYFVFYLLHLLSWQQMYPIYIILCFLYAILLFYYLIPTLKQYGSFKLLPLAILPSLCFTFYNHCILGINYNFFFLNDFIFFILLLCICWVKHLINKLNYSSLNKQMQLQTKFYKQLSEEQKQVRILNHDIKNHLLTLEMLLHKNKIKEAEEYLQSITLLQSNIRNSIHSGNPILDSILTAKKTLAEKQHIAFHVTLHIPSNLSIAPLDVCTIYNNLIDNAIEAALRSKQNKKEVFLYFEMKGTSLISKIHNSYNPTSLHKKGFFYKTSKKDQTQHGLGLISVKQSINNYDGLLSFTQDENYFYTTVILPNILKEKKTND